MTSTLDLDRSIGFWLRDIPYFFINLSQEHEVALKWKNYGRIYIFPDIPLKIQDSHENFKWFGKEGVVRVLHYRSILRERCGNYFFYCVGLLIQYGKDWSKRGEPIEIRVNGDRKFVPEGTIGNCFKDCEIVYDFLGLKYPPKNFLIGGKIDGRMIQREFIRETNRKIVVPLPKKFDRSIGDSVWTLKENQQNMRLKQMSIFLSICNFKSICVPLLKHSYGAIRFHYSTPSESLSSTKIEKENFLRGTYLERDGESKYFPNTEITHSYLRDITSCIAMNRNLCIILSVSRIERDNSIGRHAILMLINIYNRNIYIIDPHGKSSFFPSKKREFDKAVDTILNELGLNKNNFGWHEYYRSEDICPNTSFQGLEGWNISPGFCEPWSIWLIHLIDENPNIEYLELIRRGLRKIAKLDPEFTNFIHSYSSQLVDLVNEKIPPNLLRDGSISSFFNRCHIEKKIDRDAKKVSFSNFKIIDRGEYYEYRLKQTTEISEKQIWALCNIYDIVRGMKFRRGFVCFKDFLKFNMNYSYG